MRIFSISAGAAMLVAASPAAAQLRPLVEPPASAEAARTGVDVYLVNDGTQPATQAPAPIETRAADGTKLTLTALTADPVTVQPGAFAKVRYHQVVEVAAAPSAIAARTETVAGDSSGSSSSFLGRLRPHEPVYGAFGAGDAGGKLQLSFAFRALGSKDGPNLNFAYTQTMFWALDKP